MMKCMLLTFLATMQLLVAQHLLFLGETGGKWFAKDNTSLTVSAEMVHAEVDPSNYKFTWFRSTIPACNYKKIIGFTGRIRLVSGSGGRFAANVVLFREPIRYYQQKIMELSFDNGGWHEFFMPIRSFMPHADTAKPFTPNDLADGDHLQFILEKLRDETVVELDSLRVVLDTEPQEELRRLRTLNMRNRLRDIETRHPRILLHGEFLQKVRAKANAGGLEQKGYETLITCADSFMKSMDENAPFKKLLVFRNNEDANFQKNRAAFEMLLRDATAPVEILAAAGLITGDEKYSRKAATALYNMACKLDVESPELSFGFYYTRTLYVRTLAMGYDWCYHFLTPEQRMTIKTVLLGFIREIYERSWTNHWGRHPLQRVWNWNPGLVSCAGLGLLAMEGETTEPENAMIFEFRRHLRDYLTLGIDFDGACLEGPSYISYGIGCGIFFMEALRQQGRGDLFTDTNAHLIAPWLAFEMLPGRKSWNDLCDCNRSLPSEGQFYHYAMGRYAELAQSDSAKNGEKWPAAPSQNTGLDYIQHFSERPGTRYLSYEAMGRLLSWCWSVGPIHDDLHLMDARLALVNALFFKYMSPVDDPSVYLPDALHFRGRGLAVSRIGFGDDSLHLAVEAGPHAAGHDQADKGSFTLSANGIDIFIDSGYGNDGQLLKSSSSHAHNMVLIDGQGEHLSPFHNNSNGYITGYSNSNDYDWIRVDASDAWNLEMANDLEPIHADGNVKRYERQFLLLRPKGNHPPCLIVADDICKNDSGKHAFSWLWHYDSRLKITDGGNVVTLSAEKEGMPMFTSTEETGDASATFVFNVAADGDYKLFGLTAAYGRSIGQSDSFFLKINNEDAMIWDIAPTRHLAWSEVKARGEATVRKFHLKANDRLTVHLGKRETGAALAKLALLPYRAVLSAAPDMEAGDGATILSISNASQDANVPFPIRKYGDGMDTTASATLFIVGTPEGRNSCDWYETSHIGSHKRFIHTVENTDNPHFLMVIVPRKDDHQPLPKVVKKAENRVSLEWPDGYCRIITFDHSTAPIVE